MATFRTWRTKVLFNFFPCYRRTGARIMSISDDEKEVMIKLPLNWRTRGYFGPLFGGSIYGATDPIYMVMLNRLLGPSYVVWDKAASIRFRKPGKSTLYARFAVSDGELESIRQELANRSAIERTYTVELKNGDGLVCATVEKTLFIRKN